MKVSNDQLHRLLAEASKAPGQASPELTSCLERRVIAQWCASRSAEFGNDLLHLFRLGFSFACVLMVVIVTLGVQEIGRERTAQLTTAGAIINLALAQ